MRDEAAERGATLTVRQLSKMVAMAEDGLRDVLARDGQAVIPAS